MQKFGSQHCVTAWTWILQILAKFSVEYTVIGPCYTCVWVRLPDPGIRLLDTGLISSVDIYEVVYLMSQLISIFIFTLCALPWMLCFCCEQLLGFQNWRSLLDERWNVFKNPDTFKCHSSLWFQISTDIRLPLSIYGCRCLDTYYVYWSALPSSPLWIALLFLEHPLLDKMCNSHMLIKASAACRCLLTYRVNLIDDKLNIISLLQNWGIHFKLENQLTLPLDIRLLVLEIHLY